jgi:UDP-2,3-diacylglucosamine pyrophosphatase LpxH
LIFFISDLHLSPRSPGATALFLRFLAGRARQAEALYILGDLFEVWVGDDIDDPYHNRITAALRAASDAGLKIFVMHGNRDFALGGGDPVVVRVVDIVADPDLEEIAEDVQGLGLAGAAGQKAEEQSSRPG